MKYIVFLAVFCLYTVWALNDDDVNNEKFVEFIILPEETEVGLGNISSLFGHHRWGRSAGNISTLPYALRRFVRSPSGSCELPTDIKDYLLVCKAYRNRKVCTQLCPFGLRFAEGIQRQMTCYYEDNTWTPVPEFEKCKHYVDCTITLSAGGNKKCYTQYLDKGNECEISCDRYENLKEVPLKKYKCDIKGNWTPSLPRCAKAGTGLQLEPHPKGLKH